MKPGILSLFVLCAAVAAQARVLSVGTYVANADREVVVPVMLSDAGELNGLGVKLTYDEKALEFVEAEPGSLSGVFDDDFTVSASGNGSVSVGLFASSNVNDGVSGSIARLRFRTRRGAERQFSDLTVANAQMIESSGVKDTTVRRAVSVVNGMIRVFGNGADVERLENAQTVCAGTELATLRLAGGDGIAASTRGLTVRVPGGVAAGGKVPVQIPEEGWTAGTHEVVLLETSTDGLEFEPVGLGENDRFEVVKLMDGDLYRYTANVEITSDICDPSFPPPEEVDPPPESPYEPGVTYSVTTNGYTWSFTVRDGKATIRVAESGEPLLQRAVEPEPQGELEIPAVLGGCPVVGLGNSALYQCAGVGEIRMPDTVTSVGEMCCWGCGSLSNVVFSGALTNIGDGAFINCVNLRRVDFPATLVSIGKSAFSCASLESVFIPSSVRWIGDGAFSTMNGPGLIVTVDPTSQYFRSDDGALLSKDGASLHTWPFSRPIRLEEGLRNIGIGVFWGNQTMRGESLAFPSTVTNVGHHAFAGCGLIEVNLNEGLVSIGQWAFAGNDLQSIVIPSSVGWMDMCVFDNCDRLLSVCFAGNAPAWVENDLYGGTASALTTFVRPGSTGWMVPGSAELPEAWPVRGGADARPIRTRAMPPAEPEEPVDVTTYKVTFDANGGEGTMEPQLLTNGVAQALATNRFTFADKLFAGWATNAATEAVYADGGLVKDLAAAGGAFALFATWKDDPAGRKNVPIADPNLRGSDLKPVETPAAALTYSGYVTNGEAIVGLVTVKVTTKGVVTATVQLPEGTKLAKTSYKGTLGKGGKAELVCTKNGGEMSVLVCEGIVSGTIEVGKEKLGFTARSGAKDVLADLDGFGGRVWTVALKTAPAKGLPELMNGYSVLSVAGGKKGKMKVSGVLADGTKVSVTAQGMAFGDSVVVPVVYRKKTTAFSLKLILREKGGVQVGNVSAWTSGREEAAWEKAIASESNNVKAGAKFGLDEADIPESFDVVDAAKGKKSILPNGVPVKAVDASSGKWTLPKAGKVALVKGTTDLDESKFTAKGETDPNPAGLKLAYKKKTGLFSGSFQFYQQSGDKLKKLKAAVNGAVVDGVGYGSATVKNMGAVPVTVGK